MRATPAPAALVVLLALPSALALDASYDPPAETLTAEIVSSTVHVTVVEVSPAGTFLFAALSGPVYRLAADAASAVLVHRANVSVGPEWGLTGLALHPDFDATGEYFLLYTHAPGGQDPSRNDARGEMRLVRVRDGVETLVFSYPATRSHNSGRLLVHDGLLFVSTGDQKLADQAQDPQDLAGKILRMTFDGKPAPGNPGEKDPAFNPYVYSFGHRNPFGLAWDEDRGVLVESEVGEKSDEEINHVRPGKNYGWPVCAGPCNPARGGMVDPLVRYPTVVTPVGMVVIGKDYYIGTFNTKELRRVHETPAGWKDEVIYRHKTGILDVDRSRDGRWIYVAAWNGLWRLPTPAASVATLDSTKGPEDQPPAPTPPTPPAPPTSPPANETAPPGEGNSNGTNATAPDPPSPTPSPAVTPPKSWLPWKPTPKPTPPASPELPEGGAETSRLPGFQVWLVTGALGLAAGMQLRSRFRP